MKRRNAEPMLNTFGKRLKMLRVERGLSQVELSDKMLQEHGVKVGDSYISELERTSKAPTVPVAAAMAKVFGVSLDYLGLIIDEPSTRELA